MILGLCYAEFAAMIPIAGSAYTYSYATMGEVVAWVIGWDLVLEYAVGAATVSIARQPRRDVPGRTRENLRAARYPAVQSAPSLAKPVHVLRIVCKVGWQSSHRSRKIPCHVVA